MTPLSKAAVEHRKSKIKITRTWAMPNRHTFAIKPIKELVEKYVGQGEGWVDPFCGESAYAEFLNDLKDGTSAKDFLREFEYDTMNGVLFDPPYSPRQISECYKKIGLDVTQKDTQNQWTDEKNRASLIIKPGGLCLSFGWNSSGLGNARNFEIIEMLIVNHGAAHNDTICVVERKRMS